MDVPNKWQFKKYLFSLLWIFSTNLACIIFSYTFIILLNVLNMTTSTCLPSMELSSSIPPSSMPSTNLFWNLSMISMLVLCTACSLSLSTRLSSMAATDQLDYHSLCNRIWLQIHTLKTLTEISTKQIKKVSNWQTGLFKVQAPKHWKKTQFEY